MKRFKETMKMVVALMSLCLISILGVTAEAAEFKPGVTYVNPKVSDYKNESEYYSEKKIRMETYADTTFKIVYPKNATLSVKTNKKALAATIIEQDNADKDGSRKDSEDVYVSATVTEYEYYYKNYAKGTTKFLTKDEATGQYYYIDGEKETRVYDAEKGYWVTKYEDNKVYVTPNYTVPVKATYTDPATGKVYNYPYSYYDDIDDSPLYYDSDMKSFYYGKNIDGYVYYDSQYLAYDDNPAKYEYAIATVNLSSTKAGTYKVNVVVDGKKTTMTVYVSTYTGPFKKVTFGGKTIYSYTAKRTAKDNSSTTVADYSVKKTAKSGKFKVTANTGFKITGLVYTYVDAKGNAVYKKVKNGGAISLSREYYTNRRNGVYGSNERSTIKNTYVYVSYKDTKLGTSRTYSVVKRNGVKQIKCVEKKTDGKKYTSYLEYDTGHIDFNLWSY